MPLSSVSRFILTLKPYVLITFRAARRKAEAETAEKASATVFVRNLPFEYSSQALEDLFSEAGSLVSCSYMPLLGPYMILLRTTIYNSYQDLSKRHLLSLPKRQRTPHEMLHPPTDHAVLDLLSSEWQRTPWLLFTHFVRCSPVYTIFYIE